MDCVGFLIGNVGFERWTALDSRLGALDSTAGSPPSVLLGRVRASVGLRWIPLDSGGGYTVGSTPPRPIFCIRYVLYRASMRANLEGNWARSRWVVAAVRSDGRVAPRSWTWSPTRIQRVGLSVGLTTRQAVVRSRSNFACYLDYIGPNCVPILSRIGGGRKSVGFPIGALDCVGFPIRPLDSRWTRCWLHCSPGSRPIPLKFGTLYGSYRTSMHAKFEPDRWRFHLVLATVGPILDRCPSYLYLPYSPTWPFLLLLSPRESY